MSERGREFGGMPPHEARESDAEMNEDAEMPSSRQIEDELGAQMGEEEGLEAQRHEDEAGLVRLSYAIADGEGDGLSVYSYIRTGIDGKPNIILDKLYPDDRETERSVLSVFEDGEWESM